MERNQNRGWAKKAQAAAYILVVIILLGAVVSGIIIFENYSKTKSIADTAQARNIQFSSKNVNDYVLSCVRQTSEQGLYILGVQGGYTALPKEYLKTDYVETSYAYVEGKNQLVAKEEMQNQLSSYVTTMLRLCINNFTEFKAQGIAIEEESITAKTTVGKNDVTVEVSYPLTVTEAGNKIELKEFSAISPIRLGHLHEIASEIIKKQVDDPYWIDLSQFVKYDVQINLIPVHDNIVIYQITDNQSRVKDIPYIFVFAEKLKVNPAPEINAPDVFELNDSERFVYQINITDAENDEVNISAETAMFAISNEGVIDFIPEIPGEYYVKVIATDLNGGRTEKTIKFVVKEK